MFRGDRIRIIILLLLIAFILLANLLRADRWLDAWLMDNRPPADGSMTLP